MNKDSKNYPNWQNFILSNKYTSNGLTFRLPGGDLSEPSDLIEVSFASLPVKKKMSLIEMSGRGNTYYILWSICCKFAYRSYFHFLCFCSICRLVGKRKRLQLVSISKYFHHFKKRKELILACLSTQLHGDIIGILNSICMPLSKCNTKWMCVDMQNEVYNK